MALSNCRNIVLPIFIVIFEYFRYKEVEEDTFTSCNPNPAEDEHDDDQDSGTGGPDPSDLREAHLKALRQALAVWLDVYPADFTSDPNSLLKVVGFLKAKNPNDARIHDKLSKMVSSLPANEVDEALAKDFGLTLGDSGVSDSKASGGVKSAGTDTTDWSSYVFNMRSPSLKDSCLEGPCLGSDCFQTFLDIPEDTFAQQLTRMDKVSDHFCFRPLICPYTVYIDCLLFLRNCS